MMRFAIGWNGGIYPVTNLPRFELNWPQANRDTAIATIAEYLKRNGNHLELKATPWQPGDVNDD